MTKKEWKDFVQKEAEVLFLKNDRPLRNSTDFSEGFLTGIKIFETNLHKHPVVSELVEINEAYLKYYQDRYGNCELPYEKNYKFMLEQALEKLK